MENQDKFATELLSELKEQSKRWFIAFCVMVLVEACTIGAFLWYLSLPIEDTTITQTSDGDSQNNVVGGDLYGSKTDSEARETSGKSATVSKEDEK